jgi:ABC-type sugar transport systems, permease components
MAKSASQSLKRYQREKRILIISFLAIPIALLLLFTAYPLGSMLVYSFTDWNGLSSPDNFVGFSNYIKVFTSDQYSSVFRTALYYLIAGAIQQILALFLATILSKKLRGAAFFKGSIFFPFIMNGVAVTLIFQMFFEVNGGLDGILTLISQQDWIRKWIADRNIVNISLAFIYLWKNLGYSFIIYLGSMQSVPKELYEAAEIDGANAWQQFKAITMPNIKMMVGLLVTFAIVNSVAVFDIPYILTKGQNGTNTFTTTLIDIAFKHNLYGEACAMAIALLLIVAFTLMLKNLIFKEDD